MELLTTIASFIVAIGVLVTVHEFGHFWVARKLGVRVLRFSIGFGKALWQRRAADGTEYVVAAIPLGGYVKMLDEREEPVPPEQLHEAFNRQRLAVRTAIVAAGPVFNFLFAILAYWAVFVMGVNGLKSEVAQVEPGSVAAAAGIRAGDLVTSVDGEATFTWTGVIQRTLGAVLKDPEVALSVRPERGSERDVVLDMRTVDIDDMTSGGFFETIGLQPSRPVFPAVVDAVTPGGRAEAAGLRRGDEVLSVDGEAIRGWRHWVSFIQRSPEQRLDVRVQRDGAIVELALVPAQRTADSGETYGFIGASRAEASGLLQSYFVTERYGLGESFTKALGKTWDVSALTVRMFWKMLRLEVSVENLSGPISIAQYAGSSARSGLTRFLEFLAIVSISLGILNLLPVPILDGGHLLYFAVEAVTGRPLSEQAQYVAQHVGLVLLVGLMGIAFYNDIIRVWGS